MKFKLFTTSLIMLTLTACSQQNDAGKDLKAESAKPVGWTEFKPEGEGFSILFPGTPKEQTQKSKLGDIHIVGLEKGQGGDAFMLMYSKYPDSIVKAAGIENLLDGVRDDSIGEMGGKINQQKTITLDGNPGRDFTCEIPKADYTMHWRIYIVKNNLYRMMASSKKGDENDPDALKMLDSFKLLGK